MWQSIMRWLNPCLHDYDTVTTLKDREENPTAATIVQACRHCGDVRQTEFKAPEGVAKCPPHKWRVIQTIKVFRGEDEGKDGALPVRHDRVLQCELCGDLKNAKGSNH